MRIVQTSDIKGDFDDGGKIFGSSGLGGSGLAALVVRAAGWQYWRLWRNVGSSGRGVGSRLNALVVVAAG